VTVASHILPAQRGIRASRPASVNQFDGGSRLILDRLLNRLTLLGRIEPGRAVRRSTPRRPLISEAVPGLGRSPAAGGGIIPLDQLVQKRAKVDLDIVFVDTTST
jgi:hypothetical protein